MLVSCCNVICFSCPTCSSEGKHLFPPLQLPLQFENMSLPSPWNKPSLTSCHPSHCFSLVISSCSTFSWSAVPTAGYHLPRKAFYYHMRKEDHVMYLTDYIPVHTFHNFFFFFSRNRMPLNHVQLVTGCNPKRTLLCKCYPSSLSCPILYLFSWLLLLLKRTNTH